MILQLLFIVKLQVYSHMENDEPIVLDLKGLSLAQKVPLSLLFSDH